MIAGFARTAAWHRRSRSTCSWLGGRPVCWERDVDQLLLAQVGHQPLGGEVGVERLGGDAIDRHGRCLAEGAAEFDGRFVELGAEHRPVSRQPQQPPERQLAAKSIPIWAVTTDAVSRQTAWNAEVAAT